MSSDAIDLSRLTLLVQRLLDAELLLDAEGAPLLEAVEGAHVALERSDTQALGRHLEQVARLMEALIRSGALTAADGQAVIATVSGLRSEQG